MAYDNDNPQPLYISEGSDLLTPIEVSGNRYTFEHISINGIPVMDCPPRSYAGRSRRRKRCFFLSSKYRYRNLFPDSR